MATQTDADIEKLRAEIAQLRSDMGNIGESVKTMVTSRGSAAYARVRESTEDLQKQAKEAIDSAAHQIEQRPLTAALTAFGIGVVLGVLFSRK